MKPWTHGVYAYQYHHCRCEVCKQAKVEDSRAYYERRKAREADAAGWTGHTWPELVAAELTRREHLRGAG
jgi:hypothetical protein